MSIIPDAPRQRPEPTKGFKNGCLAAVFWGIVAAVFVGLIAYITMTWIAGRTTEQPPAVAPESGQPAEASQGTEVRPEAEAAPAAAGER